MDKKVVDALRAKNARLEKQLTALLIEKAADAAMTKAGITKGKSVLRTHLAQRLRVDADSIDVAPRVLVLDSFGNSSTASVDDLLAEFRNDPEFSPVFSEKRKGGETGSGSSGHNPFRRGGNVTEQAKLFQANPELARQLQAEAQREAAAAAHRR